MAVSVPIRRVGQAQHIKSVLVLLAQPPAQSLQVIRDLVAVLDRWDGDRALADDPVERDGRGRLAFLCADARQFVDDRLDLVPLDVAEVAVAAWMIAVAVFARKAAEGDGAVGDGHDLEARRVNGVLEEMASKGGGKGG